MNHNRFKEAPWYEGSINENIMIGGVGGIGSNALYSLAKTIPATYYIFDDDVVSAHNFTQFFTVNQLEKLKVEALVETMSNFGCGKIMPFKNKIKEGDALPITISAFDNMGARKLLFNSWKKLDNREIFIDGRLRANLYEVYAVKKGEEEKYELSLFDDDEVDEGPCTFKQTAYFAILIGARITHVIVNYLTNKHADEEITSIPFKIQELGEPFLITVE